MDPHPASVPKILRQGRLPAGRALLRPKADMVYCHGIVMYCQDRELICAVKIDSSTYSLFTPFLIHLRTQNHSKLTHLYDQV